MPITVPYTTMLSSVPVTQYAPRPNPTVPQPPPIGDRPKYRGHTLYPGQHDMCNAVSYMRVEQRGPPRPTVPAPPSTGDRPKTYRAHALHDLTGSPARGNPQQRGPGRPTIPPYPTIGDRPNGTNPTRPKAW